MCQKRRWEWRDFRLTISARSRWRPRDYLRIAHEFHTIILDHIPVMDHAQRNEAKRFIILIDTLYDHAVKLVASAQAQPDRLYLATDGYEAQEFKRTASRLIEMRSQAYLGLPHGPRHADRCRSSKDRRNLSWIRRAAASRLASGQRVVCWYNVYKSVDGQD